MTYTGSKGKLALSQPVDSAPLAVDAIFVYTIAHDYDAVKEDFGVNNFFAYLARLRLIRRWGLMYATQPENDAEHSLQVAMIAHGLAVIARDRYGKQVDPDRITTLAVYHDVGEIFTGDLPTPVKHHDGVIHGAYAELEQEAMERLLHALPQDLQAVYAGYLFPDESTLEWKLVKAADRISAWCRCKEETGAGNREFASAEKHTLQAIEAMHMPEVEDFMREFGSSFGKSLDEMEGN